MLTVQHILEKKKKGAPVQRIAADATVLDGAEIMNRHRIGALVVTDDDRVIGIVTERDVMYGVVAARKDPAKTVVRDVMTAPVACCSPETTLAECRGVMRTRRIRHLPVVRDEKLVGIISIMDIIEDEVEEQNQTIRFLHEYMYGEYF